MHSVRYGGVAMLKTLHLTSRAVAVVLAFGFVFQTRTSGQGAESGA